MGQKNKEKGDGNPLDKILTPIAEGVRKKIKKTKDRVHLNMGRALYAGKFDEDEYTRLVTMK